jgi:hypothetical protein
MNSAPYSLTRYALIRRRVIEDLLFETRKFIGCIYKIAEAVALIDMVRTTNLLLAPLFED